MPAGMLPQLLVCCAPLGTVRAVLNRCRPLQALLPALPASRRLSVPGGSHRLALYAVSALPICCKVGWLLGLPIRIESLRMGARVALAARPHDFPGKVTELLQKRPRPPILTGA